MYLSNRDLIKALDRGDLIVEPRPDPARIGPTSIDLSLDSIKAAQIWNLDAFDTLRTETGDPLRELRIGKFDYRRFSRKYLMSPTTDSTQPVFRRGDEIIVKPGGFLLWQTKEDVGTSERARLICFIDGKSSRARTGIVVHLTAPTIHAGWHGRVTLEIANLGPFAFVLAEDDVIAQITVAEVKSRPMKPTKESLTIGQVTVMGRPEPPPSGSAGSL